MATINDISFRIIKRILAIILLEDAGNLREWKEKLPYIGVCQSWRYFGLNFVYDRVFFVDYNVYLSWDTSWRQRRGRYFYQRGIPNKKPVLVSNIELFIMMNRCDTVQIMHICANISEPQNMFLDELFELLKQTKGDWIILGLLNLLETNIFSRDIFDYSPLDYKDKIYDLGPIIEYAKSHFTAIAVINSSESDTLVGKLLRQLQVFFADTSLSIIGDMSQISSYFKHLPRNIAYLILTFDKTDEILYLPFIYAESIQKLVLNNIPPRFDWTCFKNSIILEGGKTVFQRLWLLYVSYDFDHSDKDLIYDRPGPFKGFNINFSFPCLAYLYVENCSTNNLLFHSEFPIIATRVDYIGQISSIVLCQQIKIKSKEFRIHVTSAESCEQAIFYNTTDEIFTDSNRESLISISLQSIHFSINVDLVEWSYLSRLTIDFPIDFEPFVKLLQKLTSLKYLYLDTDSTKCIQDTFNYQLADIMDEATHFIFSQNLVRIRFLGEYNLYKYKNILNFIIFLITSCPKLGTISFWYDFKKEINYFIDSYGSEIPSLKELDIEYWSYLTERDYVNFRFWLDN